MQRYLKFCIFPFFFYSSKANESAASEARKLKMDVASLKASVADMQERNVELNNLLSLKTNELQRLSERFCFVLFHLLVLFIWWTSFIACKSQIGELSLELENARTESKQLLALQQQNLPSGAVASGGSLLDDLADPRDEQLHLLEEERDQLLNDLKMTKALLTQKEQSVGDVQHVEELKRANMEAKKRISDLEAQLAANVGSEVHMKSANTKDKERIADLEARFAESSRAEAELREKTAQLEAEKTQLRNLLKMAKEKLTSSPTSSSNSRDLEIKLMSQKVHAAGVEILRLKQELGRAKLSDSSKVNGMLNHLRSLIDPFD
jgi:chromosome segregation ATPase